MLAAVGGRGPVNLVSLAVESMTKWRVVAFVFATAQVGLVCYIAFVAWLMSGWFIDDSIAFRLSDVGWWQIAAKRVIDWSLVSAAVGLVAFVANRAIFARCGYTHRAAIVLSGAVAAIPLLGSIAGSTKFILDRPFL